MASTSPLDCTIKGALLRDVFNVAGFYAPTSKGPYDPSALRGRPLTPEEKAKHALFVTNAADLLATNQLGRILRDLTVDDVLTLIEAEDELARRGALQCIFPSAEPKYLLYTATPRYYNLLLVAWRQRWAAAPEQG
jgi:hypothetical protein